MSLSRQDVFNTVYTHLLTQGARSIDGFGECLYRAPDGRRCAAGVLIADRFYHPSMEGISARVEVVVDALKKSGVASEDIELVQDLQDLHDDIPVEDWQEELERIAKKYELEVPA